MENIKKYLNENQNSKAVKKVLPKIEDLLTSEEQLSYLAVQKKPILNFSPICLALTNRRVIFCRPKMLGLTMQFQDFSWKEVEDCHIKEGLFGSTFTLKLVNSYRNHLKYLPKAQARQLYRFAQEKEEAMKELRRQRILEDKRASSGGIYMSSESNTKPKEAENSPEQSLKKLKNLLEQELIDQKEFDEKKKEILQRM